MKIKIKQIAFDPGVEPGYRAELYGVGEDGVVYQFSWDTHTWRPISQEVHKR